MHRWFLILFFALIPCASAFPQDSGIIQCDSDTTKVPAWTAPGSAYLVDNLSCGQMVSAVGLERGFVKIQIGEKIAYVNAKYVRFSGSQPQPLPAAASTPPPQERSFESSTTPIVEIFAGYSYLNIDTNNLTDRQNANGWEASVSGYFTKWLAAEFAVSGYYKTYSVPGYADVAVRDYSYLAGPRVKYGPVFAHVLLGGDSLSAHALGDSASQTGFASAFGGGVQIPINDKLSFRAGADYVLSHHNIYGGSSVTQNNFRASAGIVIKLGSRKP